MSLLTRAMGVSLFVRTAATILLFSLSLLSGWASESLRSPLPGIDSFPSGVSSHDRQEIHRDLTSLNERLSLFRRAKNSPSELDHFGDVDAFVKGVVWALRYETALSSNDVQSLKVALRRGRERLDGVTSGQTPWAEKKGKVVRGFVSSVDGSTQPYGLIIPAGYDPKTPIRLDVVFHGSSKPVGLSELRFMTRFDEGDRSVSSAPNNGYIELHPLGRVENCYRWAGETDVFEAIEAVCRNYAIDRDRIVLRGMSMGASGTWHLGLKHPDRFVALGPYCGYVDTHRFSETPIDTFIKVGRLPEHQERGLHLLDSVDYAANAGLVPAIGAIGDKDVFFQAHVIMREAMAKEGLVMTNLISRGTGHVIDPATHREQMRLIGDYSARGIDRLPRQLRFVTWTLKYPRYHWLELLSLQRHYDRAEMVATISGDDGIEITTVSNVTRFAIHPPLLQTQGATLRIGGFNVPLPRRRAAVGASPQALVFSREGDGWNCEGFLRSAELKGKRPGLQGPIDDAFTAPFLCVRGTGRAWHPAVGAWAEANLRRFAYDWSRYMRGDLPVKDDTEVTEDDLRNKNLILFGDPGSNRWIRKALPKLPVSWSRSEVSLGDVKRSAVDHAPTLICENPLRGGRGHYLVINSGHTFHESEFAALNYLLFPRLGDWALMKIEPGAEAWERSSASFPEAVIRAGFFDESWKPTPVESP